jgi:hypothetical protein
MTSTIDFGVPGVTLEPGDHVCALFFGNEERDEIIRPFLGTGLDAGDKCIAIIHSPEPAEVVEGLAKSLNVDVDEYVAREQLQVMRPSETYLRSGSFATEDMISFFDEVVTAATGSGAYPFARITGETTWLFDEPPGAEDFLDYESQLNDFVPKHPQVVLCLYDLQRFGGGMVVDLLRTHPKLLLGGLLLDNPNYMSPEEYRAARAAKAR